MVEQMIVINCRNINEKGFGILLTVINEALEKSKMDLYVKTEIKTWKNKEKKSKGDKQK